MRIGLRATRAMAWGWRRKACRDERAKVSSPCLQSGLARVAVSISRSMRSLDQVDHVLAGNVVVQRGRAHPELLSDSAHAEAVGSFGVEQL